jgi:hypothetical protein
MISTMVPEEVNEILRHVTLARMGRKTYGGREDGYNILCTCRHPREAFLSHQNFNRASDWKSVLVTFEGEVVLSIYQDRMK